jgi:hypothetical protein
MRHKPWLMAVVVSVAVPSGVSADVFDDWNERLVNIAIGPPCAPPPAPCPAVIQPPPVATLTFAIVQTAVYDAVNAIDGRFTAYAPDLPPAADGASMDAAVAAAAHDTMVWLFPAKQGELDLLYAASLGGIPEGEAKENGIAIGRAAAESMIRLRQSDGRFANVPYTPGSGPGQWRPVAPAPSTSTGVFPWIGQVLPFAIPRGDQFLPDGPPPLSSAQYAEEFNEVKALGSLTSTARTPEQTAQGWFWTDHAVRQFNGTLRELAIHHGLSLADKARLFAMWDLVTADAIIGCWNAKYHYGTWRPEPAIHEADTDGNPLTEADPTWRPLAPTPNHPEYVSGHNCYTGAGVQVLQEFFGTDKLECSVRSVDTSPDRIQRTRTFSRFSQVIRDVGMARIYSGFHFRTADNHGRVLGQQTAHWILKRYFLPVD